MQVYYDELQIEYVFSYTLLKFAYNIAFQKFHATSSFLQLSEIKQLFDIWVYLDEW